MLLWHIIVIGYLMWYNKNMEFKGSIKPQGWQTRLEAISDMKYGWGESTPPTKDTLKYVYQFIELVENKNTVSIPAIFPDIDEAIGGIRMEWFTEGKHIALVVYNDLKFNIDYLDRESSLFTHGNGENFNSNFDYILEQISNHFYA